MLTFRLRHELPAWLCVAFIGCAGQRQAPTDTGGYPPEPRQPSSVSPNSSTADAPRLQSESETQPNRATDAAAARRPIPKPGEAGWLPEVRLENVGFHIGGGPNDEATKAPFQRAIAKQHGQLLKCYRLADTPGKGGTFGVDLFIRREGGNPEVRQPRTGMSGDAFKRCMIEAFKNVNFDRPSLGPTIISYSVRFDIIDPSG